MFHANTTLRKGDLNNEWYSKSQLNLKQLLYQQVPTQLQLFPAQTAILAAGVEVTEALTGATALTFDIGTGDDDDEFVAAYAMAGKSVGAVAPSLPGIAYVGAEDTLDLTIDTHRHSNSR